MSISLHPDPISLRVDDAGTIRVGSSRVRDRSLVFVLERECRFPQLFEDFLNTLLPHLELATVESVQLQPVRRLKPHA